jgi:hypothetical protein
MQHGNAAMDKPQDIAIPLACFRDERQDRQPFRQRPASGPRKAIDRKITTKTLGGRVCSYNAPSSYFWRIYSRTGRAGLTRAAAPEALPPGHIFTPGNFGVDPQKRLTIV